MRPPRLTTHVPRDPGEARVALFQRQDGLCLRCYRPLGPLESDRWDAHHRLARRHLPRDMPDWCLCNLVGLCHDPCHVYGPLAVHRFPEAARDHGLRVEAGGDPRTVVLRIVSPWDADVYLDCEGLAVSTLWTSEEESRVSAVEATVDLVPGVVPRGRV